LDKSDILDDMSERNPSGSEMTSFLKDFGHGKMSHGIVAVLLVGYLLGSLVQIVLSSFLPQRDNSPTISAIDQT